MSLRIIIVGAGIGGLTAALCCAHQGFKPIVLERAAMAGDVGAGIQIPPNAMKVFDAIGIADRISRDAFEPDAIEARMGPSGRRLFQIPLKTYAQTRWGAPYLHIHRTDYIAALMDSLRGQGVIQFGAKIKKFSQDEGAVCVQLEDGSNVCGDVLIGADGIHSVIREQLHGSDAARFTGNVAWRAVVPIAALGDLAPDTTACLWMGPGRHAVTYRLRRGELANLVAVVERADWQEEGWAVKGNLAEAQADFAGWHPKILRLLEKAEILHRWALFDRKPLPFWSQGRVTLLGDSAHPMLPFMAQGAAMAVEDAWSVVSHLARVDRVEAALELYQTARITRTSKVQAASFANAKTFHQRTTLGQIMTYGPMWLAGHLVPTAIHRRQDWLYGYDVTA